MNANSFESIFADVNHPVDVAEFMGDKEGGEDRKIIFTDVTLRDGNQAPRCSFTPLQKLLIALALVETGIGRIEAGFPASAGDGKTVAMIADYLADTNTLVGGLAGADIGHVKAVIESLKDAKNPYIHTFLTTNINRLRREMGIHTPEEVLRRVYESVSVAAETGWMVQWSPEDFTRAIGKISPELTILAVRMAIRAGATVINLPDTVGHGNFDEIGHYVAETIRNCQEEVEWALSQGRKVEWSIHCHNDRETAVASTINAIKAGVVHVEGCMGYFGERAGNVNLPSVIEYLRTHGKKMSKEFNYVTDIRTETICALVEMIYEILGQEVPESMPIIGRRAQEHGAGIHKNGQNCDDVGEGEESAYNDVEASKYGPKQVVPTIGSRGGFSNFQSALEFCGVKIDGRDKKKYAKTVDKCKLMADRTREVSPAYALFEYSRDFEGAKAPEFKPENGTIVAKFEFEGAQYEIVGERSGGSGGISALMHGIQKFVGNYNLDIYDLDEDKKSSDREVAEKYRIWTGIDLTARIGENLLVESKNEGSDAEAIIGAEVYEKGQDRRFIAQIAGNNVQETNLEAVFVASWPWIRAELLRRGGR